MTESNFTLGALSPESSELVGGLDPILGSISAPAQPATSQRPSSYDSLLSDGSTGSPHDRSFSDVDLDLGFYFGQNDSRNSTEEQHDDLIKNRPGSSSSQSSGVIDALSEQLEASLEDMIQTAQMHPRSLQVRNYFILFIRTEIGEFILAKSDPVKVCV